jgi:signal transduction histidine kinase
MIRHDKALLTNQRLLDGVSTALRLTVDNGRLRSEIEKTLEEVRESRQRIVDAGDAARRRIERNLHDGAQQQLVVLGITLRGIEVEAGQTGRTDLADRVDAAITQLNGSMAELRTLARGIHPSLLTEGGLALALPELVGRCPIPTELTIDYAARVSPLLEATVYFVVSEALANAAKHSEAKRCRVLLTRQEGVLELVVRDDGRGGVDVAAGSGVLGMSDRIEAVDGTLEVRSAPGEGTTLTARLPLA